LNPKILFNINTITNSYYDQGATSLKLRKHAHYIFQQSYATE